MRSRDDLLARESGQIIPEFRSQKDVLPQAPFDAASDAEDDFPDIVIGEAGDLRDRLKEGFRTGDNVVLGAQASGNKWTQSMIGRFEMEEQFPGEGDRLSLYIDLYAGRL